MQFKKTLEIKANHKQVVINVADILYIKASVNDCYIHVTSGSVYKTRSTLEAMEAQVGEYFLKVHRTYLVCIMAIRALEDTLTLINGEKLNYSTRRRKEILVQLQEKQRKLIATFALPNTPHCRTLLRHRKSIMRSIEALIRCHLHLRISRWYSMRTGMQWIGYSAMEMRSWQRWSMYH